MLRRSALWATGHLGPATRTRFRERLSYFQRAADRPALSGDEQAAQLTPLALREARLSSREPAVCLAEAERVLEHVHNQAGELVVAGSDAMQHATSSSKLSAQHRSAQAEDVLDDSDPFLHEDEGLELRRDAGGTISAVPIDTQALVTEEFRRLREKEVRRRRQILYELMNPVPTDYRYNGKLVPVPPISFGVVAPESKLLGAAMFTSWPYHLVRQSEKSDYFFEINDLYIEIALVGRANAGKSSLINALVGHPVAKTSSLPHSTRTINFYQNCDPAELDAFRLRDPTKLVKLPGGGKQFTLVDIPGFGIEGMSDKWRDDAIALTDSYMGVRRSINTVIFCIDAEKGFTPTDRHYIEWLGRTKGLVWVVVTRADAVPHGRLCAVIAHIYREITRHRKKMQNVYPFVLPVSSHDGSNIDVLRGLIVETSGVVPGDKLREILRKRSHLALQQAREQEAARLERNRREEINAAKGGTAVLPQPDQHRELASSTQSQAARSDSAYEQAIDAALRSVAGSSDLTKARVSSGAGVTMKVHTGLGGLGSVHRDSGRGDRKMRGKNDAMAHVPLELIARAESGELAADMAQRESRSRPLTRQLDEHEKRLRAAERMSHRVGRGTTFVAERADGTVTGTEGGRAFTAAGVRRDRADRGGLVLKSSAEAAVHRAAMERANAVEDTASSSGTAHMTSRERSAYERYNGTNGLKGEKRFWEEVNSSKIVNDTAWARNPRDDKQREYSQGARISWPNQPAGLSRKYGSVSNTLGERRRGGPLAVKGL